MTTINLGAASWALAKARLRLEVAASASLDAHDLVLKDNEDLLSEDIWIQKGHNFHFSFLISFDSVSSNSDMLNGDTLPDFVASVLTQAPFWSQLHLAPSFSAPHPSTDSCRVNKRSFDLNLNQDSGSDCDLSNVKPPNGISAVSLASVHISLRFSQIPAHLKRFYHRSEEASPNFEDLLCHEPSRQIPELDLEIPDWQYDEVEAVDDCEAILDLLPYRRLPPLRRVDNPLKSLRSLILPSSGSLCLSDSSFRSLETCNLVFSSQTSNLAYRLEEDIAALSDEQSSSHTTEIDSTAIFNSVPTFKSLEPERSGSFRSTGKGNICSRSSPTIRTLLLPQQTIAFYQPILNLTDAALRKLIHPQPTRLSAGIKSSDTGSGSGSNLHSGQDNSKPIALSDLAPSIFTPGYARGVIERAPLVPSIAKSLAAFMRHRRGLRANETCGAELQGGSEAEEGEGEMQEDVKEILRGHVWMTMTNGLRISHSTKARRLRPLAMPSQWREENREEDVVIAGEEEVEMLDETFVSCQKSPRHGEEQAEKGILEGLEGEVVYGIEDELDEDLLLDDEKIDLSFLEEEFEDLCLFGRDVEIDAFGDGEDMDDVEVELDGGFVDHMEEMLF